MVDILKIVFFVDRTCVNGITRTGKEVKAHRNVYQENRDIPLLQGFIVKDQNTKKGALRMMNASQLVAICLLISANLV